MLSKKRAQKMIVDLEEYSAKMRGDRWNPRDPQRYEEDAAHLQELLNSNGLATLAQTPITLEDVEKARVAYANLRDHFEADTLEERTARDRIRRVLSETRFFEKKHPEDPRTTSSRKLLDKLTADYKAQYGDTLEYVTKEAEYRAKANEAQRYYIMLRRAHVAQCAAILAEALARHVGEWSKQPTHYKRTREAVGRIADAALLGTGCRADLNGEGNAVSVNHCWAIAPEIHEYTDETTVQVATDEAGRVNPEAIRKRAEGLQARDIATMKPADVRKLAKGYEGRMRKIEQEREKYREAINKLTSPYDAFEMGYEMRKQARAYA